MESPHAYPTLFSQPEPSNGLGGCRNPHSSIAQTLEVTGQSVKRESEMKLSRLLADRSVGVVLTLSSRDGDGQTAFAYGSVFNAI